MEELNKEYFFKSISLAEALLLEELVCSIQSEKEQIIRFERKKHQIKITTEQEHLTVPKMGE